jgi:hypothetical protein
MISPILRRCNDMIDVSFNEDHVNVPTVGNKHNLESHYQKEQDPDLKSSVRSKDPDPYKNVTDQKHCIWRRFSSKRGWRGGGGGGWRGKGG